MFLPFSDPGLSITQALIASWQPSPLYVSLLLVVGAQVLGSKGKATKASNNDVRYVKSMYAFSFIVAAVSHVALLYRSTQVKWSLVDIFVPRVISVHSSVSELIYYIFQLDFVFIFAAAVFAAYITVIDAKRVGRSSVSSLVALISLLLGTIAVGPGAVVAAVWWWREDKLRFDQSNKMRKAL